MKSLLALNSFPSLWKSKALTRRKLEVWNFRFISQIQVDLLSQSKDSESPTSLQSDLGGIETSVKKLDEMLTQTLEYVNKVVVSLF